MCEVVHSMKFMRQHYTLRSCVAISFATATNLHSVAIGKLKNSVARAFCMLHVSSGQ